MFISWFWICFFNLQSSVNIWYLMPLLFGYDYPSISKLFMQIVFHFILYECDDGYWCYRYSKHLWVSSFMLICIQVQLFMPTYMWSIYAFMCSHFMPHTCDSNYWCDFGWWQIYVNRRIFVSCNLHGWGPLSYFLELNFNWIYMDK